MEILLPYLTSGIIVSVVVGLLKKVITDYISPRFGSLGVQLFVLLVSFAVAGFGAGLSLLPAEILSTTALIFASAISVYEVVWKALFEETIKGK